MFSSVQAFALIFTASLAAVGSASSCVDSEVCSAQEAKQAPALLQARHDATLSDAGLLEEGASKRIKTAANSTAAVNPSGAAAPLDETGYSAVADRCCLEEVKQFVERQAVNMGLEVCDRAGLSGIVPYHSCLKGVQTLDALSANLLEDSKGRCAWLATTGNCKARPADCPSFSGEALIDCGCSRSKASTVDFSGGQSVMTENNLGGEGPSTGPQEMRYSRVGTSDTGVTFDLVVTSVTAYKRYGGANANGVRNGFGIISLNPPTGAGMTTDFKFSFVQPGTNTPVELSEVHMAIYDLDGATPNGIEIASSKGYRGYVTDINPSVVASRLDDGRTKFSSSGIVNDIPNPTDPNSLTPQQRANSVMYFYTDVSGFDLSFGIEGAAMARNLFFTFASPLNDRCNP